MVLQNNTTLSVHEQIYKLLGMGYIFQLSLWLRDVLDDLCHRKLRDGADFEWQRYIRPYLTAPLESDPMEEQEEGHTIMDSAQRGTVVLRCLDQQMEYGFEYLGCASVPVFTTRANNYIIAFTQVSLFENYTIAWTSETQTIDCLRLDIANESSVAV